MTKDYDVKLFSRLVVLETTSDYIDTVDILSKETTVFGRFETSYGESALLPDRGGPSGSAANI
jgi:hypothetical protein